MKLAGQSGFTMKKQSAAALCVALMASVPMLAQQAKPGDRPVRWIVEPEEKEVRQLPQPANGQGIVVHGHWVMELRDKEGTLLEHRDFHNSLTQTGSQMLTLLLTGQAVTSNLALSVGHSTSTGPQDTYQIFPSSSAAFADKCGAGGQQPGGNYVTCVPALTQTANATSIVLQGQFTAARSIPVETVGTSLTVCVPGPSHPLMIPPSACAANQEPGYVVVLGFTSATLSTPISMSAGQVLTVNLTLSFS